MSTLAELLALANGRRIVALTGAGISTESGIPDYRGPGRAPRVRDPMQHREFVNDAAMRKKYWARSMIGFPKMKSARPNEGHRALVDLESAGILEGIITQNVDGLHTLAGSRSVVELHGALARVRCLSCQALTSRDDLQTRLIASNRAHAGSTKIQPDGDVDLPDEWISDFEVLPCESCGGVLMPDVVFFGGSVPKPVVDAAWAMFDRAELLLVVGSSLAVYSGFRFVRRAAEREVPIVILNHGPTRGDPLARLCIDARAGEFLRDFANGLGRAARPHDLP